LNNVLKGFETMGLILLFMGGVFFGLIMMAILCAGSYADDVAETQATLHRLQRSEHDRDNE